MERILLAWDALEPIDKSTLEFATYLARLTRSKLTAVFLENMVEHQSLVRKAALPESVGMDIPGILANDHNIKVKMIEDNIQRFKDSCTKREVNYALSRDRGIPLYELIEECRFADLLILDATTTFDKKFEGAPSRFVKDVLSHAECPVIIAPESFESIDEIVFAYDGSASSAFAIREFAHVFPQFQHTRVNIIQVSKEGSDDESNQYLLNKWLTQHYSDLHFQLLRGDIQTELFEYLFKRKNVFIVMGAYGRNYLSQIFKKSHAELIINTVTQPVFIAHR